MALRQWERYLVKPGERVRLGHSAADATELCADKKSARKELKHCRKRIDELMAALAAESARSLLVILQGVDASGKDGAVRKVFSGVNPQHCKVVTFKEPDREEQAHDYLWRVYRALPAKGEMGVFNRSQYEDVVTLQARGRLSRRDAYARLRQIADIERTWAENGMVIRKFLFHISRKEQAARFKARLENAEKHWKVEASDFKDRKLWPQFVSAYEEALARTSKPYAPWHIIPADHKWYRDVAVASLLWGALRGMRPRIPVPKLDRRQFRI